MPTINVTIKNLPEIKAAFNKAPILTAKYLNRAIKSSIFTIERDSKINTPVDTGRLRASHTSNFSPLKGVLQTNTDYDIYVHEGTRRMRARPFMLQAVESNDGKVQDFFTEAVQNVLDDIARSV